MDGYVEDIIIFLIIFLSTPIRNTTFIDLTLEKIEKALKAKKSSASSEAK